MHKKILSLLFVTILLLSTPLFTFIADAVIDSQVNVKDNKIMDALYVSPSGSDSNEGSFSSPFATIQHALNNATPGITICLREGVYYEEIDVPKSGNAIEGYIKVIPYNREHAVIDGSHSNPNSDSGAFITIDGKSYIQIEGIEFRNLNKDYAMGISVLDGSNNIVIRGNTFHDINTTKLLKDDFGGANAITVKSYNASLMNYNLLIENNIIYNCVLGYSEALVLSGNTSDFQIRNNTIKHVTNIGIDIAGHYGDYVGNPKTNQARNGIVSGNLIIDCKSDYGSGAASGLYVDGGRDVIISNNIVQDSDYGITIGCEAPGQSASNITVTLNRVFNNEKSGISIGGYKLDVGTVTDCLIFSNKTYKNNTLGLGFQSELNIKRSKNIKIYQNIFFSSQILKPDFNDGERFYPMIYNDLPTENIELSDNVYYAVSGIKDTYFRWNDQEQIGFENYKIHTSNDASSDFYNPLYLDPDHGDLNMTPFKELIDLDGFNRDWIENTLIYIKSKKLPIFTVFSDARSIYLIYEPINDIKTLSIYIDSDQSAATGYKTSKWLNSGVDYLIENNNLYKYSGTGPDWSFIKIAKVPSISGKEAFEYKIPRSYLNVVEGQKISIGTITNAKTQLPEKNLRMKFHTVKSH